MAISGSDVMNGLIARGYSPVQAAALAGHILQESGGDPTNVNTSEGAHGLLQWRLDRWNNLQDFARSQGASPNDPNVQLDFIGHEMRGPEAKSGAGFMAASDLPSASAALKSYIRFGDNSAGTRLANAQSLLRGSAGMLSTPTPTPTAAPGGTATTMTPAVSPGALTDNGNSGADDSGLMQSLANVSKLIQQPAQEAPPAPDLSSMAALGRARQLASIMRARQMMEQQT